MITKVVPTCIPWRAWGRVTSHFRLPDGTYNLLLLGLQRVRLVRESKSRKPYREAEVALCEDTYPALCQPGGGTLGQRLRDAFVRVLPWLPEAHEQMDQLLATDMPLGVLTDVISFMLEIEVGRKETLLAEVNVHRRAQMLLEHLEAIAQGRSQEDERRARFRRGSALTSDCLDRGNVSR